MIFGIDAQVLVEELEIHEIIVEIIDEEVIEALGVTPETISEFMDRDIVRDFVAHGTYELIDALIQGQTSIEIAQEEILQLIRAYAPFVEEEFGLTIEDEILAEIETFLEESEIPERIIIDIPPLVQIESQLGNYLEAARWILMPSTMITLAAFSIFLLMCVILINLRHISIALRGVGITAILSGILFVLLGLSIVYIASMFISDTLHREIIHGLLLQMRTTSLIVGAGQFAAGIILLLIGRWR